MSLAALILLLTAAPEAASAPAAAAPPPAQQARVVGVARARIIAPVRMSLGTNGAVTTSGSTDSVRLVTHRQARRDGALVVDCY